MSRVFNWNPQRAVPASSSVAIARRMQIRDGLALRAAHRLITGEASNIGEDAMAMSSRLPRSISRGSGRIRVYSVITTTMRPLAW